MTSELGYRLKGSQHLCRTSKSAVENSAILLGHVDRPNASAGAQIQYPEVFAVVHWGSMQLIPSGLEKYGVEHIHPHLLLLQRREVSAFALSMPAGLRIVRYLIARIHVHASTECTVLATVLCIGLRRGRTAAVI